MIKILLASNNEHKLEEFRLLFKDYDVKIYSLKDLNINIEPEETGKTYLENSKIKAKSLIPFYDEFIIADDSGVEFEALGNHFPGIYSHRYAQENGGYLKVNQKLVDEIPSTPSSFHCLIYLITPNKEEYYFEGIVEGKVANKVSGNAGFGYDPLFIPNGESKTYAELGQDKKDELSHRRKAIDKLIKFLKGKKYI